MGCLGLRLDDRIFARRAQGQFNTSALIHFTPALPEAGKKIRHKGMEGITMSRERKNSLAKMRRLILRGLRCLKLMLSQTEIRWHLRRLVPGCQRSFAESG